MQDQMLSAADFVGADHVETAVAALREIAANQHEPARERITAAETLLRYGVRDPFYSPPTSSGFDPEDDR